MDHEELKDYLRKLKEDKKLESARVRGRKIKDKDPSEKASFQDCIQEINSYKLHGSRNLLVLNKRFMKATKELQKARSEERKQKSERSELNIERKKIREVNPDMGESEQKLQSETIKGVVSLFNKIYKEQRNVEKRIKAEARDVTGSAVVIQSLSKEVLGANTKKAIIEALNKTGTEENEMKGKGKGIDEDKDKEMEYDDWKDDEDKQEEEELDFI